MKKIAIFSQILLMQRFDFEDVNKLRQRGEFSLPYAGRCSVRGRVGRQEEAGSQRRHQAAGRQSEPGPDADRGCVTERSRP